MNQLTVSNLATPAGRAAFQDYWRDLVVEQRRAVLPSLVKLWRHASFSSELRITWNDTHYRLGHPLGPRVGTRVFMEEIIFRHYYNNVQAFVYLGAVVLLVFLGLRFAGVLAEQVALIGIGIEAFMLLMLVMVMFYTPSDESTDIAPSEQEGASDEEDEREVITEVLREIEEIGGQYASVAMKLESLARSQDEHLAELARRVGNIQGLNLLESHAERLETTNALLGQLTAAIEGMNTRVDALFGRELEFHVRRELERLLNRPSNGTPGHRASEAPAPEDSTEQ